MRGSVRKRGGTWTAYWFAVEQDTGKRRQHSKGGFQTRSTAESHLNQIVGLIESGTWSPSSKTTVKSFVEDAWLPSLASAVIGGSMKPTTEHFYKHLAKRHIIHHLGSVRLKDLTAVRLNAFYADLLTTGRQGGVTGLSPTTVSRVHVTMHRILRDAVKWGHVPTNVADLATPPRPTSTKMKVWSPTQIRKFVEITSADRLGVLWRLLLMTGLRRGEACGLQWLDIDLDQRRMDIARARVMAGGQVVLSTPKTAASARSIGLDPQTVSALRRFKALQATERLAAGTAWSNHEGWIFTDEVGRPVHPNAVSKLFANAVTTTSMPKIRLHDLRHSYATAALEAGVPLKVVSERFGHKRIGTTADIYSHVRPEVDQAAADQVAGMIMSSEAN